MISRAESAGLIEADLAQEEPKSEIQAALISRAESAGLIEGTSMYGRSPSWAAPATISRAESAGLIEACPRYLLAVVMPIAQSRFPAQKARASLKEVHLQLGILPLYWHSKISRAESAGLIEGDQRCISRNFQLYDDAISRAESAGLIEAYIRLLGMWS